MMSRFVATLVLVPVILMGTVSPAETCAIWCLGSNGGHEHHEVSAPGMLGHHHAGMTHARPLSLGSGLCEANCSGRLVARAEKSAVPQERVPGELNLLLANEVAGTAERDGDAVVHFGVAGPPGLASCKKSILRI